MIETKTLFDYELFQIGDNYIVCIPNKNVLTKSISKLTQFVPAGEIDTYSFQMPEPDHNYILDGMVHKNSHAASYSLLAYRCMLLKAHFFPEWIAAVLNDCNSQKIPRYIRAAIAEKWQPTELTKSCKQYPEEYENFKFKAFDVNNLSANFEAHGNVVTMGLLQAKGVGESSLGLCVQGRKYESIKQFVDEHNPNLKVMTILIKLGAFDTIPGHQNRKALYTWYYYYTKKNKKPDRVAIDNDLITKVDGWTEASIESERQKQAEEFKNVYPKKKVPASILKWMPEPNVTPERLSKIIDDYTYVEILGFEKEHLGYTLSDPLKAYKRQYFLTINDIRTATEDELSGVFPLECVVLNSYIGETSTATKYLKVEVTDGCDSCMVFIWSDALHKINQSLIQKDSAVLIPIRYNKERDSMSLSKYHTILPLDQAY
jgi:DNA polymerase III alpha subunit